MFEGHSGVDAFIFISCFIFFQALILIRDPLPLSCFHLLSLFGTISKNNHFTKSSLKQVSRSYIHREERDAFGVPLVKR